MKTSTRSRKLAGIIEEVLPPIIRKLTTPEEVGFLTVTAVEVSGDLSVCDVFIRTIGHKTSPLPKLKKITKKISAELTKQVPTRRTLLLRFKTDKSVKNFEKINQITTH